MRYFSAFFHCSLLISSTGHIKMTDFGLAKIGPVQMTGDLQMEPVERIVREFTDKEVSFFSFFCAYFSSNLDRCIYHFLIPTFR